MDDNLEHLSKRERRRLRKERKKEKKINSQSKWLKEKKSKKLKFWGKIGFVVVVIGVIIVSSIVNGAKIQVTPSEHSFGRVSVRAGKVNTTLVVENPGKKDLIIKGLETSCMCTSAVLVVDGVVSPIFGMSGHGTNPKDWSARISPGGEAQLMIYYDPTVHKDFRGPVTRKITVSSNAPFSWSKTLTIRADQVS